MLKYLVPEKSQKFWIMPTAVARGLGAVTGSPPRTHKSKGAVTQRNEYVPEREEIGHKNVLCPLEVLWNMSDPSNAQLVILLESSDWDTAMKPGS